MRKKIEKIMKFLLLTIIIVSEIMTPISVFAEELSNAEFSKGDIKLDGVVSNTGSVTVSAGELTNEGDIYVTKTVSKTDIPGKYNITFNIKGNDVTNSTDIAKPVYAVVVFDRSGSMEENVQGKCINSVNIPFLGNICIEYERDEIKFSSAVSGAQTFADTLLEKIPGANIALVTFSTNAIVAREFANADFDNDTDDTTAAADFGSPNGGTNLHAGLIVANQLFDDSNIPSDAYKYVVVISDGQPTYYMDGTEVEGEGNYTNKATLDATFDMANTLKSSTGTNAEMFSIGYLLPEGNVYDDTDSSNTYGKLTAADILRDVATVDSDEDVQNNVKHYMDSDPTVIAGSFTNIATQISKSRAGTNAILTDNMGGSFKVISTGSSSYVSEVIPEITEDGTTISFDIEIDPDVTTGWHSTNDGFVLEYTASDGTSKSITCSSNPEVYWVQNEYDYTVNYYKDEITSINDTIHYLGGYNGKAHNGDIITLNNEQKNFYMPSVGYELASDSYSITIDKTRDNVINVLYIKKAITYNVNYMFEDNGNYIENTNLGKNNLITSYGNEINSMNHVLDNVPTGYEFNEIMTKGSNDGKYIITENGTEINVYYDKIDLTYDVKYLFEDLNGNYNENTGINGKIDVSAKYGDVVDASTYYLNTIPSGYVLNVEKSDKQYNITNNDTVVNIYYDRSQYVFNVNYYFNGTKEFSSSDNAVYGATISANSQYLSNDKLIEHDKEGYFLEPNNESNNSSIEIGTDNNELNIYYINTYVVDESIDKSTNVNKIDNSNDKVTYNIKYNANIVNVRKNDIVQITVVDTLPCEIDESNSNLNGGIYNSENKTITWTFATTIEEFSTKYNVSRSIEYTVLYKNISSGNNTTLVNTVVGNTSINDKITAGVSDTASVDVEIYGDLIVNYVDVDDKPLAEMIVDTGLVGETYITNEKEIFGYTLISEPSNKNGTYIEGTTEVTYVYRKNAGTINNHSVDKKGPFSVDNVNDFFEYTITSTGKINGYVGDVILKVTDNLPYTLNSSSVIDDKCTYDGDKTIVCTVNYEGVSKDIELSEIFEFKLVFNGINTGSLTNVATSEIILDNNSDIKEDKVDSVVSKGDVISTYKDIEGNVLEEEIKTTDFGGKNYTTKEKDIYGYTLVEVPSNQNGTYMSNQTIYINYVYTKNVGSSKEELVKEGLDSVHNINSAFDYVITYNTVISDYVGNATLVITDELPYEIDIINSVYSDSCVYDNKKLVCTYNKYITERDNSFDINEKFTLYYINVDNSKVTNKVNSVLTYDIIEKENDNEFVTSIQEGSVIVNYITNNNVKLTESVTLIGPIGTKYTTLQKEFDGYTFKSVVGNTEGVYGEDIIEVTYVYDFAILPPQTGVEIDLILVLRYILLALSVITLGTYKIVKEN